MDSRRLERIRPARWPWDVPACVLFGGSLSIVVLIAVPAVALQPVVAWLFGAAALMVAAAWLSAKARSPQRVLDWVAVELGDAVRLASSSAPGAREAGLRRLDLLTATYDPYATRVLQEVLGHLTDIDRIHRLRDLGDLRDVPGFGDGPDDGPGAGPGGGERPSR